jgi:hypothetical protein
MLDVVESGKFALINALSLIGWLFTNLGVGVTGVLSRVLVEKVERVARELDAASTLALHEEGILAACKIHHPSIFQYLSPISFNPALFPFLPRVDIAYG